MPCFRLILAFVSSAVLWLLLEVEFLAIVLVLVYVGAVMVLFLFVVMMLDINTTSLREGFARYAPVGCDRCRHRDSGTGWPDLVAERGHAGRSGAGAARCGLLEYR